MVDVNKLKGQMKEKNITQEKLSKALNIALSTLSRKLNSNGKYFTIEEADIITKTLGLNAQAATEIFFAQLVA